ncbi:hypothetical protein ACFOQM_04200 [Paenibacillus sp. GCM10012307]|uniref:DUF3967 domain-containing protein n=1 Tax=Paenibacillus roseus TaxID=2798579 RepID=A0A934J4Y7_9BACL|nr:hypothetical protein [Paenibacillus roseus]MBJ6360515.1 hypothetical protein [Paenibacillus roseus]
MAIDAHNRPERSYWSREVAGFLQIGDSTVRKWCKQLESQGYIFFRDDQGRRGFTTKDIDALRYFKELTQDRSMALESAASEVSIRFSKEQYQADESTAIESQDDHTTMMARIIQYVNKQEEFNMILLKEVSAAREELQDQKRYIEESLNRRDEILLKHLKDSLEERRAEAKEKSKHKWWKFGKR